MSQHSSLPVAWPTPAQRTAYAQALERYATLEAQAGTTDPAAAVAHIKWMIEQYRQ